MEQTVFLSDELRSQKSTNWLIGLCLALGLLFLGFEFTQREIKLPPPVEDNDDKIYESEMVPVTNEPIVAPPVPPEQVVVVETPEPQIEEVDDEQEIEQEQEIVSTEDNNQAISAVVGTGSPVAASGPIGPVGPVVEAGGDDKIYDIVEENASFPGGEEALMEWLSKNLKYPTKCQEQGVQGQVVVGFVVEKDGKITDVKIVRSHDEDMSKEAMRVVKEMPKWKPGKQGNKPVRSRFNLPIRFRLG